MLNKEKSRIAGKKLEQKKMKQIMGGSGGTSCRCVEDSELRCCWDFDVKAPYECPKGSQYACFIPYCWLLPCANPADDSL